MARKQLDHLVPNLILWHGLEALHRPADLLADRVGRIHGRVRVLEDHLQFFDQFLIAVGDISGNVEAQEVAPRHPWLVPVR